MSLLRKPIKIGIAAEMLGTSPGSIRQRLDGTESLTLFRRKGSNRLYTWLHEVESILKNNIEVVAEPKNKNGNN